MPKPPDAPAQLARSGVKNSRKFTKIIIHTRQIVLVIYMGGGCMCPELKIQQKSTNISSEILSPVSRWGIKCLVHSWETAEHSIFRDRPSKLTDNVTKGMKVLATSNFEGLIVWEQHWEGLMPCKLFSKSLCTSQLSRYTEHKRPEETPTGQFTEAWSYTMPGQVAVRLSIRFW
jgi:hypothetical protein